MIDDLVLDIGMHRGADTEWCLAKGFRVVAVEANPALVKDVTERFADAIAAGRLIIENVGIGPSADTLPFSTGELSEKPQVPIGRRQQLPISA